MYHRRVTRRPRFVEAIIFCSEESPPPKTRFIGASPYSFGRANPCPVGFLPGDGEFRVRFVIRREKAARIADYRLPLSTRKDSRCNLAFPNGQIARRANRARTIFGCERSSVFYEAIHSAILLLSRRGKKTRILWLALRKRK